MSYLLKYHKYKSKYLNLKNNYNVASIDNQIGGVDLCDVGKTFNIVLKDDTYYYLHNKGTPTNPIMDFITLSGSDVNTAVKDYLSGTSGFTATINKIYKITEFPVCVYFVKLNGTNKPANIIATSFDVVKKDGKLETYKDVIRNEKFMSDVSVATSFIPDSYCVFNINLLDNRTNNYPREQITHDKLLELLQLLHQCNKTFDTLNSDYKIFREYHDQKKNFITDYEDQFIIKINCYNTQLNMIVFHKDRKFQFVLYLPFKNISSYLFTPMDFELDFTDETNVACKNSHLNTAVYTFPENITIGNKVLKGVAIPIIIRHLILCYLGINKSEIMDASSVGCKDNPSVTIRLPGYRNVTCHPSIYYKFGYTNKFAMDKYNIYCNTSMSEFLRKLQPVIELCVILNIKAPDNVINLSHNFYSDHTSRINFMKSLTENINKKDNKIIFPVDVSYHIKLNETTTLQLTNLNNLMSYDINDAESVQEYTLDIKHMIRQLTSAEKVTSYLSSLYDAHKILQHQLSKSSPTSTVADIIESIYKMESYPITESAKLSGCEVYGHFLSKLFDYDDLIYRLNYNITYDDKTTTTYISPIIESFSPQLYNNNVYKTTYEYINQSTS